MRIKKIKLRNGLKRIMLRIELKTSHNDEGKNKQRIILKTITMDSEDYSKDWIKWKSCRKREDSAKDDIKTIPRNKADYA